MAPNLLVKYLPLDLPLSLVLDLRDGFSLPNIFAAFDKCLTSVSVCGGDSIASSRSIEFRRDCILGVADARCDLDRDTVGCDGAVPKGDAPKSEPSPVDARWGLVRDADGVFDILSEPDDFDMTSRSLVDDVRADLERLMSG
jgi:hypothetical protein